MEDYMKSFITKMEPTLKLALATAATTILTKTIEILTDDLTSSKKSECIRQEKKGE